MLGWEHYSALSVSALFSGRASCETNEKLCKCMSPLYFHYPVLNVLGLPVPCYMTDKIHLKYVNFLYSLYIENSMSFFPLSISFQLPSSLSQSTQTNFYSFTFYPRIKNLEAGVNTGQWFMITEIDSMWNILSTILKISAMVRNISTNFVGSKS